jgi:hypothetical protein
VVEAADRLSLLSKSAATHREDEVVGRPPQPILTSGTRARRHLHDRLDGTLSINHVRLGDS